MILGKEIHPSAIKNLVLCEEPKFFVEKQSFLRKEHTKNHTLVFFFSEYKFAEITAQRMFLGKRNTLLL